MTQQIFCLFVCFLNQKIIKINKKGLGKIEGTKLSNLLTVGPQPIHMGSAGEFPPHLVN